MCCYRIQLRKYWKRREREREQLVEKLSGMERSYLNESFGNKEVMGIIDRSCFL